MDKAKPIFKTLILGLTSLVAILGLILIPMMTCSKSVHAAPQSLTFNQLVKNGNFANGKTDWNDLALGTRTAFDGYLNLSYSGTSNYPNIRQDLTITGGHKYFVGGDIRINSMTPAYVRLFFANVQGVSQSFSNITDWTSFDAIATANGNYAYIAFFANFTNAESHNISFDVRNVVLIDLTDMFGAGNEPSTVASFRSSFPLSYYDYSAGQAITAVSTENDLISALSASSVGENVWLTDNITISNQSFSTNNATLNLNGHTLDSSYHPNNYLYSTEGWYTSQWSGKNTSETFASSTTYYARFQTDVNSATTWGFVLGNSVSGDIINITGGFSYTTSSFTIPANVTVNKNGNIILPPANAQMTPVGYNADASASTDTTTYVANTTYYAIYVIPTYTVRLIIDPEVAINISGIAGATRTEYASYSSIDFSYNYGQSIQFPLPTWNLHSFNGWWLNGTTGAYSGISSTDYGNKVFYARWVEAPEITIGNVSIFRSIFTLGDRLIMFTSNIDWQNLPNENVRTMFMFRLMDSDGSTVLASAQPYYAYNGGYYLQAVGFYFPDDSVIEWGGEYQIRIDGNPSQWYTISDVREIYNISGLDYSEASSNVDNQIELASWIINISQLLENDWLNYNSIVAPLISTDANGNQVLTNTGKTYFINTIANINKMAPSIFGSVTEVTPINPDNPMPEVPASPSLITRWENQYEGTWVQDSFQALGDLFHVSWRTITSILCLVLWVIFAAISQMRWGTTDAGLWMGAVMFGVMVTMGLMNWAVVITAAILMSLYSLYIVFWRQG